MRIPSHARMLANTQKVLAKGMKPVAARPAAMHTMFISATPTSKNRSGNRFWKR